MIDEAAQYAAARSWLDCSASEVKREMGTDILRRVDSSISDTKLVELVMCAIWRLKNAPSVPKRTPPS
jgi:hypothetical protein